MLCNISLLWKVYKDKLNPSEYITEAIVYDKTAILIQKARKLHAGPEHALPTISRQLNKDLSEICKLNCSHFNKFYKGQKVTNSHSDTKNAKTFRSTIKIIFIGGILKS